MLNFESYCDSINLQTATDRNCVPWRDPGRKDVWFPLERLRRKSYSSGLLLPLPGKDFADNANIEAHSK